MKRLATLFIASSALLITACSTPEVVEEQESIEVIKYSLQPEASMLEWAANMGPDYGHNGTISITEGTLEMQGEDLIAGTFTIDMNSIKNTDLREAGEEGKATYLEGHLTGNIVDEDHPVDLFFNSPAFPAATVTLNNYSNGKLNLTVAVLGKEITQDVEALIQQNEDGATISGDFDLDFDSIKIPGLQPDPESGAQINPKIDFKLNVVMSK